MSGNLNVSTINGVDVSVSGVATQAFANSLLYEAVVTGSAVTSIDFPLLDINTHKSYRVEIEIVGSASVTNIYMFVNGDTAITNYYSQGIFANATSFTGGRNNEPRIGNTGNEDYQKINVAVSLISSKVCYNTLGNYSDDSSIQGSIFYGTKTATVTNITQLTFTSSVASAIGVGSKIRIYRGDV